MRSCVPFGSFAVEVCPSARDTCLLASVRAESLLRHAPLRVPESVATVGILGDDGIALLSKANDELTVHGYGNGSIASNCGCQ